MPVAEIGGVTAAWPVVSPGGAAARAPASLPFGQVVHHLLQQASTTAAQAHQAVQDLAVGRAENLHEVLLSVAQADLTFRLILEIRNRLTEAYQEILRMQV
ncbi:MAG: flagellar hook-basal body complex protein FliE [Gemmatales bacterium]|nr:flagellar hook-basal body complex protein FliE [Gemmatales bacterium]MCS7160305.1 flagellar hook-basal body complex protein FliE [Gemmatales bacterium]MDW8175505.1 flagellar hook-basal body complex protein FliE [Gemmatales bacterium]MDW8222298.1 flagellar hook-basal body complex protein FliE [Gemmatales bacterium]